jgi:DNA (cytosine-5)-methyltransferase 1
MANTNRDERHRRGGLLQVGRGGSTSEAEDNAATGRIKWPAEPDIPRVAYGVSARVAKLRAYGNAIVPQVGAAFIGAFLDAEAM